MSELSNWRVEVLRLTIFASAIPDAEADGWWGKVTGETPETKTVQPRAGSRQEVGAIKKGLCNLSLEIQPQRIDWQLTPIVKADETVKEFPTFANLADALVLFRELLSSWLTNDCPPPTRIAFGAILTQVVPNKEAGYELLGGYLPSVKLDPVGSSDLLYQINRPRLSKCDVPGLKINRLSRWSVARLSGVMIQLSAGGKVSPQMVQVSDGAYAGRVELDINTFQESEVVLQPGNRSAIFEELVALGVEIASKGDIA